MRSNPNDWGTERIPSDNDASFGWSIKRTPPDKPLSFVCVSADFFGVRVHYYCGRTVPHLRAGCEPCSRKHLSRWKGYILGIVVGSGERIIFEFTPAVASSFLEVFDAEKSLRGVVCVAKRTSNKPNGKLHVTFKGLHSNANKLPSEVPIPDLLARIWGYSDDPGTDEGEPTGDDFGGGGGGFYPAGHSGAGPRSIDMPERDLQPVGQHVETLATALELAGVLRPPAAA
jgi:hypothetical protein